VNAAITIAPSATNEVGHNHTFTATVLQDTGSGLQPVGAGVDCNITLTGSNGASPVPPGPLNTVTNASGQCSITFTSQSGGKVTGHAFSTLIVDGQQFTVQTNGVAPNSGDAVKTFVDANIQLTPPTATNMIGTNHVMTCHVNVNDGSGGFANAPAGTVCTGSIQSGPGSFVGSNQCTTVGATGSCQLTITSATPGTTVVRATTTLSVGGVVLTRATNDAHAGDSPDAQKTWVNARISIAPNGTNEVGHNHTFTVTIEQDTGSGFAPVPAGTSCNITLIPANGASPVPAGPFNLVTNAAGQCAATFTSQTGGTVTGNGSSTLTINGVVFNLSTNGVAPNSGPAVKTFVDANIQLTPGNAFNQIGTNHVLTCHVNVNDGSGGFANAPAGTVCTGSIQSGPGSFVGSNQCTTGGSTGDCQLTITSGTPGTTVVRATTTLAVGGVVLTRTTGDSHAGDSADAKKTWEDARITISPNGVNEVGNSHTFTVLVEKNDGSGWSPAAGVTINSTISGAGSITGGSCGPSGSTNAAGQCTVVVNSNTAGVAHVTASGTLTINGVSINVATNGYGAHDIQNQKTWVDANIQLTPATATNPVGTNHTLHCHINVNDGTGGSTNAPAGTVCTVNIVSGPGTPASQNCTTVGSTGTCDVVITSNTPGTTTLQATTTLSVLGVTLTRTTGDAHAGDGPNATKLWADDTVNTKVRDAAGNDITGQAVAGGTVVHDEATVAKVAGTPASVPNPTGTVSFTLYNNGSCNGTVVATDPNKPLNGNGVATSATFTTPNGGGSFSYRAHYNGDANYPAHDAACEPFSVQSPGTGQIAPTSVSCQDFTSGNAPTLTTINYPSSNGKIGQGIDPGVFFYYAKITTTVPNQVVTVSQSNTSINNAALFSVAQGSARLYTGNCNSFTLGTIIGVHDSGARYLVPTPGNYVISIKYDSKSIAGTNVPVPATITYNFVSSLGPSTAASVVLAPK
jgi:hypothetical protein